MTIRRIRLKRLEPQNVNFGRFSAYRMRIEVAEIEGPDVDKYIFIYRKNPINPYTDQGCDEFCAVIGPSQYATIPAVEADPNKSYPFYRLDYVELDFISQRQALDSWQFIQKEVCILIEGMGKLTQLKVVEDIWCPSPPDVDSISESESQSQSQSQSE